MGSGKSLIGYSLAQKLHLPFIDLDKEIEKSTGCSISDFFRIHGETEFRKEERRLLMESGSQKNEFVMATGGGTPCFHDNMNWMNESGTTLYLQVSLETLVRRLKRDKQKRPLLSSLTDEKLSVFVNTLFREREQFYETAQLRISPENYTPESLIENITNLLR